MKKLLSIILALSMILSMFSVVSAAPTAQRLDSTSIVNVTGKVADGTYVNLLLLDGQDNVKHVQEVDVEADGTYRAKFKFTESTDGLKLQVKQGTEDVTDSVISAVAENEAFTYTFGVTTLKTNTIAIAEFENYFNVTGKTYVLMVAFYDEAGKLISVKTTEKKDVAFDESSSKLVLDIPEGTEKIKTFMWDSVEKMIPLAKEKTTRPSKALSILTIGNSFTDDPTAYLGSIAKAEGFDLKITKAHHGGSSLLNHWTNYVNNTPYYDSKTVDGATVYTKTLLEYIDPALNGGKYFDMITIQQVSDYSGVIESYGFAEYDKEGAYDNCATNLVKLLRTYQPKAEIVLQQTWAYEDGTDKSSLTKYYNSDPKTMYNMIDSTVKTACELLAKVKTDDGTPISLDGKPLRYIPTGDAFNNAKANPIFRTTFVKNVSGVDPVVYTLHRDSYHSSHLYGRYLGALVWYGALSGNSPLATTYKHKYSTYTIDDVAEKILKNAAQDALEAYGRWN